MFGWIVKIYIFIGFVMFGLTSPGYLTGDLNPIEFIKFAGKCAAWPYLFYEQYGDKHKNSTHSSYKKNNAHTKINANFPSSDFKSIPSSCSQYSSEPGAYELCEFARSEHMPLNKVSGAAIAASLQFTSSICNYSLTESGKQGIQEVLKDADVLKAYNILLTRLKSNNLNYKSYCNDQYQMFKNRFYR